MRDSFSLWNLLTKKEIIIPRIQRDYAQGRKGKEYIRSSFLGEIVKSLCEDKKLTLDFVYGNTEGERFYPLDGQQRLTTLWLVHWYLAFKTGKLEEAKNVLGRFSYETRASACKFCQELCEKMWEDDTNNMRISDYIQQQTWFYAEWMQDPTISAMLRTISGESGSDDRDNIEQVFKDQDLDLCWNRLTEGKRITFELMIIGSDKLPISDDLYIKMNARGKKLTDFENFKADWVSFIQKSDDVQDQINNKLYSQYFPDRIDNDWTDVFWNSACSAEGFNGNIDNMFFAFINRYVLNQICICHDTVLASYYDEKKYTTEDEAIKIVQKQFSKLYRTGVEKKRKASDEKAIKYEGFDIYRSYLGPNALKSLDSIFTNLSQWKTDELHIAVVDDSEEAELTEKNISSVFSVIPPFSTEEDVLPITQKERIYFHAVCLFLEKPTNKKFNEWWRVVRNLTENAAIDSVEAMIACLRFVDGLGKFLREKDWDVYQFLSQYPATLDTTSRLGQQWAEEKIKADKINSDRTYESKITTAEAYSFFNGSIRFLFTDGEGNADWSCFDAKFRNAQGLFDETNTVRKATVKTFLSLFESFEQLEQLLPRKAYLYTTIGYHSRYACWKTTILCNKILQKQVDSLLKDNPMSVAQGIFQKFVNSAVGKICEKSDNYKYRYRYSPDAVVRRDHNLEDGVFVSDARCRKVQIILALHNNGTILVSAENPFLGDFLWGMDVLFTFNGKTYRWNGDNEILIDGSTNRKFNWTNEDATALQSALQTL